MHSDDQSQPTRERTAEEAVAHHRFRADVRVVEVRRSGQENEPATAQLTAVPAPPRR